MRKWARLASLFVSGTVAFLLGLSYCRGPADLARLKVRLDEGIYPVVRVEVNGVPLEMLLDLGSDTSMSLKPSLVERTGALGPVEEVKLVSSKGKVTPLFRYVFQELNMGIKGFRYYSGTANPLWEEEEDFDGKLGLRLLERTNLLLNLPSREVVLWDRIESLEKLGIKLQEMIELPLLDSSLLLVDCITELGPCRAALHSGSATSFVDKAYANSAENWHSQSLLLGGEDYGGMLFTVTQVASELDSIDLILGLDFLMDHVVCIDYVNRRVYINRPQKPAL